MDVNKELKFLWKSKRKQFFGGRGGGGSGWGVQGGCELRIEVLGKIHTKKNFGKGGGLVGGGVRVDVNAMLGVGGGVGYRRYCTMYKKVLYNIKKIKKMWGGG